MGREGEGKNDLTHPCRKCLATPLSLHDISVYIDDRQPTSDLGKFRKAISQQWVHRTHFMFGSIGSGFRGRRIEWHYCIIIIIIVIAHRQQWSVAASLRGVHVPLRSATSVSRWPVLPYYFRLDQIQDGGWPSSWKFLGMTISLQRLIRSNSYLVLG